MTNKIKLIDRLKSWLVTLGIASVFGLTALGVNAANSYQKTSAYDYSYSTGKIYYHINNLSYDVSLLGDYFTQDTSVSSYDNTFYIWYVDTASFDELEDNVELVSVNYNSTTTIINFEGSQGTFFAIRKDLSDNSYSFDLDYDYGLITIEEFSINPTDNGYYSLLNYTLSYTASQSSGNFITALTDFMSLIAGGIVDLAQTIGAGVVSFASGLFLDSGHLSILGGIIGIFCGIALAVGITSKVYAWVSTLGN